MRNVAVAERSEAKLAGFEVERLDWSDPNGVRKRARLRIAAPRAAVPP